MGLFKEELNCLRPNLGEKVGALFTEREGGVSSGPWGGAEGIMGLNVGVHVGDNAGCVNMNRQIVGQLCPSQPRWMTQVHGIKVVDAESVEDDQEAADAQTSVTPGVVCAVQVADCLPVLLAEQNGRAVGAVHAGWRSLAGGIIEATVARMRERLADPQAVIKAWLGPRIGFEHFETGADVPEMFLAKYAEGADYVQQKGEGKYLVDLAGFAHVALERAGVRDVEDCKLSTFADPQRFYSYRRDGEKTGRHAALVWINRESKED